MHGDGVVWSYLWISNIEGYNFLLLRVHAHEFAKLCVSILFTPTKIKLRQLIFMPRSDILHVENIHQQDASWGTQQHFCCATLSAVLQGLGNTLCSTCILHLSIVISVMCWCVYLGFMACITSPARGSMIIRHRNDVPVHVNWQCRQWQLQHTQYFIF